MKQPFESPLAKISLGIIIGGGFISTSTIINYPYGFFDSLIPVLLGVAFCTYMFSDAHAIQQANLIEVKKKNPYHGWLFLARLIVALVMALPIHGYNNKTLLLTGFIGACFWLFFDGQLNNYRNKPILSIGRTAALDKLLRFLVIENGSLSRLQLLVAVFYKLLLISAFAYLYLK